MFSNARLFILYLFSLSVLCCSSCRESGELYPNDKFIESVFSKTEAVVVTYVSPMFYRPLVFPALKGDMTERLDETAVINLRELLLSSEKVEMTLNAGILMAPGDRDLRNGCRYLPGLRFSFFYDEKNISLWKSGIPVEGGSVGADFEVLLCLNCNVWAFPDVEKLGSGGELGNRQLPVSVYAHFKNAERVGAFAKRYLDEGKAKYNNLLKNEMDVPLKK